MRRPCSACFPGTLHAQLNHYLHLNDWSLIQEVERWSDSDDSELKSLGREWNKIIGRKIKWKMAYSTEMTIDRVERGMLNFQKPEQLEASDSRTFAKSSAVKALPG